MILLYVILWLLLWFRPHFGFVAVAAVGMLVLDAAAILFFGILPSAVASPEVASEFWRDPANWLAAVQMVVVRPRYLLFVIVGVAIVALRKWLVVRKSETVASTP